MEEVVEDDTVTVKKVCQDFRVREDGALASKLQEEEYQKHYCRNKSERKTVRGDVRVAKQTYLEEVRTAHLLPEDELVDMEETDKWLAKDLQEKLHDEERREIEQQAKIASRDAKMAKNIQEHEKEKFDREWHRRREEEMRGRERQEREHRELERKKVDKQTDLEMRDAQLAKDLQDRERQKYERERQRKKESEMIRMDGPEIDRQKELELRDARIARDLQEREKQKFDREWHRRREREMMEEQERRHYQRSASEPNDRERDTRRSPAKPTNEAITINGHSEPNIQRRNRPGSGREDKRNSTVSGGSVGKHEREPKHDHSSGREDKRKGTESGGSGGSIGKDNERKPRHDHGSGKEDKRKGTESGGSIGKDNERKPRHDHSSGKEDKRKGTESGGSGGSIGKDIERKPRQDHGEEAVVALPTPENSGGRLEHDRIIMADGTEIRLFESEEEKQKDRQKDKQKDKQNDKQKDKEKDLEKERIKKDEEYAKMLQDQERRIVDAEKIAAEDKKLALEEQDRELAKHLQRKEYHRMQQERKERQMRRANSVPSDRHSVNLQDPRRLPSYEEAVHRHQMPDLLPENHDNDCNRYSYMSTNSSGGVGSHPSSLERETNLAYVEEAKHPKEQDHERSQGSERLVTRGPQQPLEHRDVEHEDERVPKDGGYSREDSRPPSEHGHTRDESEGRHLPRESASMRDYGSDRFREHGQTRDERDKRDPSREQGYTRDERDDRHPPQGYRDDRDIRHPSRDHGITKDDRDDRHLSRDHGSTKDDRDERHPKGDDVRSRDRREGRQPSPTDYERLIPEQEPPNHNTNNEQDVWLTRDPEHISPQTSLERYENLETNRESVRMSYASSGQGSYDRRSHTSGHSRSPPSRGDVWERFEDEDDDRNNRQMVRSCTVASSHPTNHDSERALSYNVVEGIDPTFRRKPKKSDEDPKDENLETKVVHLIKPHRRRSAEKKKEQKKGKKREL